MLQFYCQPKIVGGGDTDVDSGVGGPPINIGRGGTDIVTGGGGTNSGLGGGGTTTGKGGGVQCSHWLARSQSKPKALQQITS